MKYSAINSIISAALTYGVTPKLREAMKMIQPSMITDRDIKRLFKTIMQMDDFGLTVSLTTVSDNKKDNFGFAELADFVNNNIPTHDSYREAVIFINDYNDSQSVKLFGEAITEIQTGVFDREELSNLIAKAASNIAGINSNESKPKNTTELLDDYLALLEQKELSGDSGCLDIGLDVDINPTDLIVVGGQPGMGKTALALFINQFVSNQGKKALFFSLEMESKQILERLISSCSGLPIKSVRNAHKHLTQDEWAMFAKGTAQVRDLNIIIDDQPNLTMQSLFKKCRDMKEENPDLSLITIDYLTLLKLPKAERRDLSVGEATRQFKLLAKELKTPILLLSQLSRDAAKSKREPIPADLRDSGAIEQDADKIIFPYREEVHDENSVNKGLAKIIKAKVRDGEVGSTILNFKQGNFYQSSASWSDAPPQQLREVF